jgi:hypothetical protein
MALRSRLPRPDRDSVPGISGRGNEALQLLEELYDAMGKPELAARYR